MLLLLLFGLTFATRFDNFTDLGVGVTAAGGAMATVDGGGGVHGTAASRFDSEVRPFLFDDGVDVSERRRAFDGGGV